MIIQAQGIIAYNTNLKYLHMASKITSVYIWCVCVCVCVYIALISGPTTRANIVERRICCFLSNELLLSACFLNISSFIANWRNAKQFLIGYEIETQFPSTSPSSFPLSRSPCCAHRKWAASVCVADNRWKRVSSLASICRIHRVTNPHLSPSLFLPHRRTSMAWAMATAAQSVCHPLGAINGQRIRRPA